MKGSSLFTQFLDFFFATWVTLLYDFTGTLLSVSISKKASGASVLPKCVKHMKINIQIILKCLNISEFVVGLKY